MRVERSQSQRQSCLPLAHRSRQYRWSHRCIKLVDTDCQSRVPPVHRFCRYQWNHRRIRHVDTDEIMGPSMIQATINQNNTIECIQLSRLPAGIAVRSESSTTPLLSVRGEHFHRYKQDVDHSAFQNLDRFVQQQWLIHQSSQQHKQSTNQVVVASSFRSTPPSMTGASGHGRTAKHVRIILSSFTEQDHFIVIFMCLKGPLKRDGPLKHVIAATRQQ